MSNTTIQIIKTRRSVRKFKTDPIDEAIIRDVVDCGRLAATARNIQPWEFVVVRDKTMRERLAGICEYGKFIATAPVCVVVFCRDGRYYLEDGCAAIENILLAAWAHGVATCWVAGDKKEYAVRVNEALGAPPDFKLVGLVAMGFAETPATMPPKRSFDEVAHWETF